MYSVLFNDEEFYHPIADDPSIPTFLDPTYNPEYQSKGLESY